MADNATGQAADFVFFALDVDDLRCPEKRFTLTADEIALLNPNTGNCPIFRTQADAEITKAIYRRVPVLWREAPQEENRWEVKLSRMFDMSNDFHLFRTREQLEEVGWTLDGNIFRRDNKEYLPLYEGRFGHQFNHRFAVQPHGQLREFTVDELRDATQLVEPHYWVSREDTEEYLSRRKTHCCTGLLSFRRISRNTDERTCIAAIIPWGAASYGWILSFGPDAAGIALLCSVYNSFAFDYLLRNSLSQPSIPQNTFEQIPCLLPSIFNQSCSWSNNSQSIGGWLIPRILELIYTAWDLRSYARDCGYDGPPFLWDNERRFELRCELDAAFFHLYLPCEPDSSWRKAESETAEQLTALKHHFAQPRDAVAYILDQFPIVRKKDEQAHGSYRTRERILAIYDAMLAAQHSGRPYQTTLNPPPGSRSSYNL
jgi:hypothetical protein